MCKQRGSSAGVEIYAPYAYLSCLDRCGAAKGTTMKKKIGIAALVLTWIALPAFGAHVFFGQSSIAEQIRPTTTHAQYASTAAGSLGREREDAVIAATRRYVTSHPDAPEAMKLGRELAPVDALNSELAATAAKFRVRSTNGMKAEFYDVI